jgi:MFS family permease
MLLDVSPLVRHRDFRLVFIGQTVSAFGSFLTYVALPVQIYGLTKSSARVGGAHAIAYLYSAMSAGGLIVTLFSGWTSKVQRRGAAIVVAAGIWGVAIAALGYASSLAAAVACLVLAGGADMVSGLFRMTIWNETIPAELRGRMAAIEQLSYMSGPLLGNARAGFMAERFGLARSITAGGIICVAGVIACVPVLPGFWRYRKAASSVK